MADTPMAFTARMKQFFGLKPGQTLLQFAGELKQLSMPEKQQFCDMLNAAGYLTLPPAEPKPAA